MGLDETHTRPPSPPRTVLVGSPSYSVYNSNVSLFWKYLHNMFNQLPGHPLTQSAWQRKLTIILSWVTALSLLRHEHHYQASV